MTKGVFSDYELKQMGIKFKSGESYLAANCVGSMEEEMESKVVTKSCRGIVAKKTVRGTGTGALKISFHMPWDVYVKMYGMENADLIEGVVSYGQDSVHEGFAMVCDVFDEDGEEKFKAYPNCVSEKMHAKKIENGAEEVAEVEAEISIMPDEHGQGMYEALAADLEETVASAWMTAFEPSLVRKTV